ncbi:divergent polysaccharide deacetylase family protein [Roseovarius sp.]
MARGAFSGFLVGTVLSGLAVGTVSVLSFPPASIPPDAVALDMPAGSEFNQSREDRQAELPQVEEPPAPDAAPKAPPPEPDDLASLEGADTRPAAQPDAVTADKSLAPPATGDAASGVAVESESPVLPSPQSMAPEAPSSEGALSISTEPAQPAPPEIEDNSGVFPGVGTDPAEAPADAAPEPETAAPEPAAPETAEPETAQTEQPASRTIGTGEPSGTIDNLAQGVTTDRLPSLRETPEDPAPDADQEAGQGADSAQTPEAADDTSRPAIERFAVEFTNPDNKPLMSIVLIDDGSSPIGPDAVLDFPYPISMAVDASWPGALQRSGAYRAAGFEVLAIADLPDGASATDTEVAMETFLKAVPEAVAVMEAPGDALQANRDASEQMAAILLETGHGLVMFPDGLDTAQKLAAKAGVPSATVFRDFDSAGQDDAAIRRFLDQAAFRAGQEEVGVIMVGRLRPDTISALLLWGLQDRASRVALAPVSEVLRAR